MSSGSFAKTHGADWQKLHGMGDLNTCAACHTLVRCESCHGVALPHPDAWMNAHGGESLEDPRVCLTCHSEDFCARCHGLTMPHGEGFRKEHASVASSHEDATCLACHDVESCDGCHARHAHPGIPAATVALLRKKAGLDE